MGAMQRIENLIACDGGTVWVCQIVPELKALVRMVEQAERRADDAEIALERKESTLWGTQ